MTKSQGRKSPQKRKSPPPPQRLNPSISAAKKDWPKVRLAWGAFLAFCTILGLIALWPRVVVDPEQQIDPSNPHPISFKITNTGFIPLWNLQPGFGLCEFDASPPHDLPDRCKGPLGTIFINDHWAVAELARDETIQLRLDDLFSVEPPSIFGAADISIVLSFNPWFLPVTRKAEFRFQTHVEKDGKLSWVPRPLNK